MTLDDLQQKIQQQIAAGGQVTLSDASLGATQVDALLQSTLGAPQLVIGGASLQALSGALVVQGKTSLLGVAALAVEVTFLVRNGAPDFTLSAPLPAGWTFSQSFPDVAGSWFDSLELAAPAFLLTTFDHASTSPAVPLTRGLNFSSSLTLDGPLQILEIFTSALPTPRLYGTITASPHGPVITLTAPVPFTLPLGVVEVSGVQIQLTAAYERDTSSDDDEPPPSPPPPDLWLRSVSVSVVGTVTVAGAPITISAEIPDQGSILTFIAEPAQGHPLGSGAQLADLLGGGDSTWTQAVPAEIVALGSLSLQSVTFWYETAARTVTTAAFVIGTGPWSGVADRFTLEALAVHVVVSFPLDSKQRRTSVTIEGTLAFSSKYIADITLTLPSLVVQGAFPEALSFTLTDIAGLLESAFPVPAELASVSLSSFYFELDPRARTLDATVVAGLGLDVLGDGIFKLTSTTIGVHGAYPTGGKLGATADFNGTLVLGGQRFAIDGEIGDHLRFSGKQQPGQSIHLTALAKLLLSGVVSLPTEVPDLAVGKLAVSFDTGDKSYSFHGETAAPWTINLDGTSVAMTASVDVAKAAGAPRPTVTLTGAWTLGSATFALSHVVGSNEITAAWDDLELELSSAAGTITLKFKHLPVGQALRRLVRLADPNFDFDLDPPWNELDKFDLTGVAIAINPTTKTLGFSYSGALDLGVVKLDSLSATFAQGKSVVLLASISSAIPGVPSQLSWDMVNQPPPSVAEVKAPILDLRYIGLGQHISLSTLESLTTVGAIMTALEATPAEQDPTTGLAGFQFDAAAGWFVGLDFTLLDTVSLGIIFNDPTVYGLLLSLKGEKAKALAGLSFEILYRKIADNLGLYHIDLALPTAMRHIELGEVSITLPHVVLDVYTNGNFLVDFGFPYHRDFSQSLTIELFPFTGAGGFYFGVLDSQTSAIVPRITNGMFKPVIVLGIGLQVGVGKTIDEGAFSAGVTVAVEGILEGVLAFFQPSDASAKETYWALTGSVAINVHVFGSIDFCIVQASVDIYVFAAVQITAVCHQPILLEMSAGVSVSLSVRVCGFIHIHVSFSTTVHQSFTIGSESATPWILE